MYYNKCMYSSSVRDRIVRLGVYVDNCCSALMDVRSGWHLEPWGSGRAFTSGLKQPARHVAVARSELVTAPPLAVGLPVQGCGNVAPAEA